MSIFVVTPLVHSSVLAQKSVIESVAFRVPCGAGRAAMAQSKAGLTEVNARLTEGFTEAEINVVARWLTTMQTKFPRGEDE